MCLCIKINQKPKIAIEPIVCYKCLTAELLSPCYGQKYKFGQLITSELSIDKAPYCDKVEKGLHSYADEYAAKRIAYNYSWFNQISGYIQKAPVVVKCEIPEGSIYYEAESTTEGAGLEYASDKLIPLGIIGICQ